VLDPPSGTDSERRTSRGGGGLEGALAGLAKYSFVQWGSAGGREQFRVRRLVQDVTRRRLPEEERTFWLKGALRLVNALAPGDTWDVATWPVWDPLRPHVAAVIAHADEAGITEPTTRLMNDLGLLLEAKALYREAEPLFRRALAIDEKAYRLEHPTVATDLNNLAGLLYETNRLAEAELLYRRAIRILRQFGTATGYRHPKLDQLVARYRVLLTALGLGEEAIQDKIAATLGDAPGA
jgi:tetratricopeptide (TPR) repeat protein